MSRTLSRARTLAFLGAGAAALPRGARAQAATIRFGTSPFADSYLLPTYAVEMGFFKNAGLNVELSPFASAGAVGIALAGNALDVGHSDVIVVANAFNHGVPWRLFAGGGIYAGDAPTTLLCAAQTGGVQSAKDLEGKQIGVVSLQSISSLGVKSWIESSGVSLANVKFFELPYATMVPALNRGDIAAAFIAEPFLSQLRKDVRVLASAYDAIAKSFFISAIFASQPWLTDNAATARKLVQVLNDTIRWANTHHDDTAVIAANATKLPLETVRHMTRVRYAALDAKLVQPVLDAAVKYKSIDKPVVAGDIIAKLG
jgi:ABC-type nitrate/sulfonate/bicarbonate transport system substrate-binding protein